MLFSTLFIVKKGCLFLALALSRRFAVFVWRAEITNNKDIQGLDVEMSKAFDVQLLQRHQQIIDDYL